jgi:hypothetical protein
MGSKQSNKWNKGWKKIQESWNSRKKKDEIKLKRKDPKNLKYWGGGMDKYIAMVRCFLAPQFVLHYFLKNLKR